LRNTDSILGVIIIVYAYCLYHPESILIYAY